MLRRISTWGGLLGLTLALWCSFAVASPAKNLGRAYRALEMGDFATALRLGRKVPAKRLKNLDYRTFLLAQSEYFAGSKARALTEFQKLARDRKSRFANQARWRSADCLWQMGRRKESADAYSQLLGQRTPGGEWAIGRFRRAQALESSDPQGAIELYHEFLQKHPAHVLSAEADRRLVKLGDEGIWGMSAAKRIERGRLLIEDKKWELAVQELAALDTSAMDEKTRLEHKYWSSMALFKRRRHYERAGKTFLSIYPKMGDRADEALFHGARAMSRADHDTTAIKWYQTLVRKYPKSKRAAEAQFLSGWLEFNRHNFREALPHLRKLIKEFPRSSYAKEGHWYLGMTHYLVGEFSEAIPYLERVASLGGKEVGAKGGYWKARSLDGLGRAKEATAIYRELVGTYPFSWYALLSRSRLKERGIAVPIFGDSPRAADDAPDLAKRPSKAIAKDPLILRVNELLRAGLQTEAAVELRRGESTFLRRHRSKKGESMAVLLDTYLHAGNFNRPWMLAVVHGNRRALDAPPKGTARRWWKHAYPLAYRRWVEKYRSLSGFPDYYLYTIMRKESGFDPHTHSYADAQGLLQMIPPTTKRVVRSLGITYTEDLLFDPEANIRVGAWYVGRLLTKFRGQIPIGAGSYNSGPRAVMRWLGRNGTRPIDEFVELVSYRQTRRYMKRTTETYARYKYLYDGTVYVQPLSVNTEYIDNEINY